MTTITNVYDTLGDFVREKRLALKPYISLRHMAELLRIPLIQLSNLESNLAVIHPTPEVLERLSSHLQLDANDIKTLHQLAANCRKQSVSIPTNLSTYVVSVPCTRTALRTDKTINWVDAEWVAFTRGFTFSNKVKDSPVTNAFQPVEVIW